MVRKTTISIISIPKQFYSYKPQWDLNFMHCNVQFSAKKNKDMPIQDLICRVKWLQFIDK